MADREDLVDLPGQHQLLYFTTPSLDSRGERLWFISDTSGHANIHTLDLSTGRTQQLTDNTAGRMWQYVSFGGDPFRGLAVWSVALDPERETLFYIQDNHVCRVDAGGDRRRLATLATDQTTAFLDVSSCGRWLCVPTTDRAALGCPTSDGRPWGGRESAIDHRCQRLGLNSYLNVYDTQSGALVKSISVPRCWITHVQFRPGDDSCLLYNHEWPDHAGNRRMWLWDGTRHRCLRPDDGAHNRRDWICHEVWSPDARYVLYHGQYAESDTALIGRWDRHNGRCAEIALPPAWRRYGHFQPASPSGEWLVSDGYYEEADDEPGGGRWLSLARVDWEGGEIQWTPVCRHGSSWLAQDDHPHPVLDHAGGYIYFTGSKPDGRRTVCRAKLPDGVD